MKVGEVASLIETEHPELLRPGYFRPPTKRCTEWVVVRKPNADHRFREATIKAQAPAVAAWAANHVKNSWCSKPAQQAALEFMVGWLAEGDLADNSITVPNRDMMGVLEPVDRATKGRADDKHSENAFHLFLRLADDSLSIPCIDNEIFIVRVAK